MRIEGLVRREQLASILSALLGARPDSPEWCAALEAVAVATGVIEPWKANRLVAMVAPPVVV